MTKITYIPGEIANAAIDEHGNRKPVTRTQHIFDDAEGKSQAEINKDVDDTLALHQSEINALDSQNYVTVDSFNALPATGSADTVYRVSNWDGTQQDPSVYSEYAWNGTQYIFLCVKSQIGEVFDISVYNNNAKYADLAAALNGGANIPQSLQKGGMSVKFVQSSDNKYVQYRYMGTATIGDPNPFLDENNWQGVDDEPTVGSDNLVKSGGVYSFTGGTSIITFNNRTSEHSSLNDRINVRIPIGETFTLLINSQSIISDAKVFISSEENNTNHYFGSLKQGVVKNFSATENIISIGIYFIISSLDNVTLTLHKQTLDGKINECKHDIDILKDRILSSFNLVGNGNILVRSADYKVKVGNTYLLSIDNVNIDMTDVSSADGALRLVVKAFTKEGVEIGNLIEVGVLVPLRNYYEFTIPENTEYINIIMRAAVGAEQVFWLEDTAVVEANTKIKQLYSDMQNNLIDNILHIQDIPNTVTISGITFTNNGDGTITVNGTATANAILQFGAQYKSPSALGIKLGTNYYMRGCPAGGGPGKFKFNLDNSGAGTVSYNDFGQGCLVNIVSNEGIYKFRIVVYSGQTLDNLVFAPSLLEYKGAIKDHEERISELGNELAPIPIAFENNAYYNVAGSPGDTATLEKTSNNQYKTAKVACAEGDMFIVNATAGGVSAKAFTFVDANNVILFPAFGYTGFSGVLEAPKNAAYIIISSNNKNLVSYSGHNMFIDTRARVLKLETKELDFSSISKLANNDGTFGSFSLSFYGFGDCSPMILSARAKYTTTGDAPTIRFSSGFYTSGYYNIGKEGEFGIKEWRIPPSLFNLPIIVQVTVPTGCTLNISDFSCHKEHNNYKNDVGVRLDAHLGFQAVAPENTMAAYELAAMCGYNACIVNPIANFEDEIYCYHEDAACLSYQGDTSNPVELSAAEFAALTEADMDDYRVIGFGNMQKKFSEKIPKLEDFFYLCSVTGMRPIFSTHPAPTDEQWLIIKELLKKYRLLDKIIIKAFSVGILEKAYIILGNVKGFIYDVNSANATASCDDMDNSTLVNFNGEKGIEYTVANLTKSVVETTLSRGYFCSAWSVGQISGAKYKELIQWGVSEFVDDYNCSSGLNF